MNAAHDRGLAVVAVAGEAEPSEPGESSRRAEALWALLPAGFVAEAGWDSARETLSPPPGNRLLGAGVCAVGACRRRVYGTNALCGSCWEEFEASSLSFSEFTAAPLGARGPHGADAVCATEQCPRPAHCRGLCHTHYYRWRHDGRLSWEEFVVIADPLPSHGACRARACGRPARRSRLCRTHEHWWSQARKADPYTDFEGWLQTTPVLTVGPSVSLRGLPEVLQAELLLGLALRCQAGSRTELPALRALVTALGERGAVGLGELDDTDPELFRAGRPDVPRLLRLLRGHVEAALASPATERDKDTWELSVFGCSGRLDFTVISQGWLRESAKCWVEHDLPRHRGARPASVAQRTVAAVGRFSAHLRRVRDDHGETPAALSGRDIVAFTNWLAAAHRGGELTEHQRLTDSRALRKFLRELRPLGATRPEGPAAGLPDDVRLGAQHIPSEPDDDEAGRDLPAWVLQILTEALPVLEARSGADTRRMVELLIDTGRRPDEICHLVFDCLERGSDDTPTLIYTDCKNHKPGRRLPVSEDTARVVTAQQAQVRAQFPDTPVGTLVLFPRDLSNPTGVEPYAADGLTGAHRQFVTLIADRLSREVVEGDGTTRREVFDPARVYPYAYRHSYAQRHADGGTPIDVLRELMGHTTIKTTAGYYRVTEQRSRDAVDRVAAYQVDGTGRRVFTQVTGLLAEQHARLRVGQIAVPFGGCTEPANVKAGGQACPYKFTCLGCGHFRSDPSYLPELKSYLQALLADRERIHASPDLEDWAREKLAPSGREVDKLRALIRRIETDLDTLSDDDRTRIQEAITVVRNTRQVVNLGLPAIAPPTPAPELEPEPGVGTHRSAS